MSLIGEDDEECIKAKSNLYYQNDEGVWIANEKLLHRRMSNNSICYFKKPTRGQLEWHVSQMRYSGEPGFINMEAAKKRRPDCEGLNPCAEILLRDRGLCNLTTVNTAGFVKHNKMNVKKIIEAQKLSTRIGLRMTCVDLELHEWHKIQAEDRLLGCSLTGWRDAMDACNYTKEQELDLLCQLKQVAHDEAKTYSEKLNIPMPLLITTIKPSGTLSLLAGSSDGMHYSHSEYYIRRVRINATDPLAKLCEELGYPMFPETGQEWDTCTTKVIEFPVHAPVSVTKYDVGAIQQLENYIDIMDTYVDHNASITVTVRNHEWKDVTEWLYSNWDKVVGISFLPLDDSFYQLLPYESITKEQYDARVVQMPRFVPALLRKHESTEVELDIGDSECVGGACPIR